MPNLKALKQRISSVKSTRKITLAMKMVATAGLRRFQGQLKNCSPVSQKIEHNIIQVKTLLEMQDPIPFLLRGRPNPKVHLILVTSSVRGLCGNFNMQLFQKTVQQINLLKQEGKTVKVVCLGAKVASVFGLVTGISVDEVFEIDYKNLPYSVRKISHFVKAKFEAREIDTCSICFMKFISALASESRMKRLIPFQETPQDCKTPPPRLFAVEPSPQHLLEILAFFNLSQQLLEALLESKTSEESARMIAMDNATRNADDMIDRLEVVYNRTRQAYITTELIEIIAGAEAL